MNLVLFVKYFLFLLNTALCAPAAIFLSFLDRDARLAHFVTRYWAWVVLWLCEVQLKVRGVENLDKSRAYVFMSNHCSNLDVAVLVTALREFQLRWVAKKELLRAPLFGWALQATRQVIIDRSNHRRAIESLRGAREKIASGISIALFPEGTRSYDGALLPFKKGGFILAIETEALIVPVAVNGTGTILPRGEWLGQGGEVEVVVGKPINVSGYGLNDKEKLMQEVWEMIRATCQQKYREVKARP